MHLPWSQGPVPSIFPGEHPRIDVEIGYLTVLGFWASCAGSPGPPLHCTVPIKYLLLRESMSALPASFGQISSSTLDKLLGHAANKNSEITGGSGIRGRVFLKNCDQTCRKLHERAWALWPGVLAIPNFVFVALLVFFPDHIYPSLRRLNRPR